MAELRNSYRIVVENMRRRYQLNGISGWKDDTKMVLKEVGCELDSSGSGYGLLAGSCELSTKPSSYTKGKEFLDH
jgi:hypothetical protein